MSGLDIFMGDPIYDDQHRVVRREFGVKNVIAIAVVLYVGNVLMGQMKPKSGQRKMKGGGGEPRSWVLDFFTVLVLVVLVPLGAFGFFRLMLPVYDPQVPPAQALGGRS